MYKTPEAAWRAWPRADAKRWKVSIYQLVNGEYVGYVVNSPFIPEGAKRLRPQPPYPSDDPREGTREALRKVEERYKPQVQWACYAAVEIAKRKLTVHSREVRDALVKKGLIEDDAGPEHWLGAAMSRLNKEGILEKSGHTYKYSDASRGIHERTVTIWQLREGADTSKYE
jgi:hypothetical protein